MGDITWYWEQVVLPAKPQIDLEDDKARRDISQSLEKVLEDVETKFIGKIDREGRTVWPQFSQWSKYASATNLNMTEWTNKAEVIEMRHLGLFGTFFFT